ncbi:MAG: SDR family NAD(P)-dependent oxidoreductase [Myxococcota bacterium]
MRVLVGFVVGAITPALINAWLFVGAQRLGGFGASVTAQGEPLVWPAMAVASMVGVLGAFVVRFVLGRGFTHGIASPGFVGLSGLVLLVSFGSPVVGTEGATAWELATLELMHVTTAVFAVASAEWAFRPHWDFGAVALSARSDVPRTAVVSGATDGIGAEVALRLASLGYRVVGLGRSEAKARRVEARHPNLSILTGDLSSMAVATARGRAAGEALGSVGLVVHCVGTLPTTHSITDEGLPLGLASSWLARLAIQDALPLAPDYRMVNVAASESSDLPAAFQRRLRTEGDIGTGMRAHGSAQLGNDLWVGWLAARGHAAWAYGPGAVRTSIRRDVPAILRWMGSVVFAAATRRASDAAADIVRVLLDPELPASGFASRHGVHQAPAFVADPTHQDEAVALAKSMIRGALGKENEHVETGDPDLREAGPGGPANPS